jgi:hypothetical protein
LLRSAGPFFFRNQFFTFSLAWLPSRARARGGP